MYDDYSRKECCGLESRAIRSLLKSDQSHRIILLSVNGKIIEGILDIDAHMNMSQMDEESVADEI